MRITGWHIDGYGRFHDQEWTDLSAGLTVFHGPNEAGKSTLLSFLRSMLFGFKGRNTKDPAIPALGGGRHGGTLHIADRQGATWTVERYGRDLRLLDGAGTVHDEAGLKQLLGYVNRDVFEAVFAFSLQELEALGGLDQDSLRDQLFASSLTGGGRSAHGALAELDKRVASLYRRNTASPLKEHNDRLKALRTERRYAVEGQEEYTRLCELETSLANEVGAYDSRLKALRRERDRLDRLDRLWETLEPLKRERDERLALPLSSVSRSTVAEATEAARLRAAALASRSEVADRQERRASERDAIEVDERLVDTALALDELSREAASQRDRLSSLDRLRADRDRLCAAADKAVAELGSGWDCERVLAVDASLPVRQAAATWSERVAEAVGLASEASRQATAAVDIVDSAELHVAEQEAVLCDASEPPSVDELTRASEALPLVRAFYQDLKIQRQAVAQAEQALDTLRRSAPRAEQLSSSADGLQVSMFLLVAVISVVVGVGLAAAGHSVGGVGLVVVGLLVAWAEFVNRRSSKVSLQAKQATEAETGAHATRIREQEKRVVSEQAAVAELESRLRDAARRADLDPDELVQATSTEVIERRVEEVRARQLQRATFDGLAEELERVRTAAAQARTKAVAAAAVRDETEQAAIDKHGEWRSWATEYGIAEEAQPSHAREFLDAIERAQQAVQKASEAIERTGEAETELETWATRAHAVLAEAQRGPDGEGQMIVSSGMGTSDGVEPSLVAVAVTVARDEHEGTLEALRAANLAAQEAVERARRRSEFDRQDADDVVELARLDAEFSRETDRLDAVLAEYAVADLPALAQACEDRSRGEALDESIVQREELVRRTAGGGDAGDALIAQARDGDVTGWAERRATIDADLPALEREQHQAIERRTEASTARRALEESVDLPRIDSEIEQVRTEAAALMVQLRTAFRARDLVDHTLKQFVRDQQPTVLRDASSWLGLVTDGRYTEVRQVIEERAGKNRPALQVVGPRDAGLDPAVLSRGTREQLYLCLRLALAQSTARQANPLPLVLDDVLVNFSPDRARAVAAVLATFARQQQVLFFTCHPTTRDLLRDAVGSGGGDHVGMVEELVR